MLVDVCRACYREHGKHVVLVDVGPEPPWDYVFVCPECDTLGYRSTEGGTLNSAIVFETFMRDGAWPASALTYTRSPDTPRQPKRGAP